jgi:hypothetical protein
MCGLRRAAALLVIACLFGTAALSKEVVVDLSSLAPADAKTVPPAPAQPQTRDVELNPNDVLVVHCPAKQYPGAERGWIEYHAGLVGTGCLISAFGKQEPHSESFQATRLGTQNVVVGIKKPGSSVIEKDCILSVKVVATQPADTKANMTNVQTFSGSSFSNRTSATTGGANIITGVSKGTQGVVNTTQAKSAARSVDELSKSTVKTYDSSK